LEKIRKWPQRWTPAASDLLQSPSLLIFYTVATFNPSVLAVKFLIVVEKETNVPIFYFKLCSFCWWGHKILIYPRAQQGTLAMPLSDGEICS